MFDVDPASPIPIYLQLVEKVRRAVALGALRPGDRFPTVREIAVRARVNRNTAARAVQELERAGVVRTRVGQGTFVAEGARPLDAGERDATLDGALDRAVLEAQGLGVPLEELGWRLSKRIDAFRRSRAATAGDRGED